MQLGAAELFTIIFTTVLVAMGCPGVPGGAIIMTTILLTNMGLPLRGIDLAALAMGGITEVEVYRRPRIGFIPTGSELIPAGASLKRGQNYDTNSIIAKHMLTELGAEPVCYPIVRDDRNLLKPALDKALQFDN